MNRYLIFASLLLATLSCSEEPSTVPQPDGEDFVSFSAQLPSANTRVVAHNHESGGFVFSWENLDALSNWHSRCTTPQKFTNSAATGAEAAFSGKLGEGATHRFLYPYEEVTLDGESTTYPIDISNQDGTLNKTYFVTQGSYTLEQLNSGDVTTLPMEHVGAFMLFDVVLESGDADKIYKLVGAKLSSATDAVPARAELDMTKAFDDEALYSSTTAGSITSQVDAIFAYNENSDKIKAVAKLNILPFVYDVDDSMTFEITVEVYEKGDNDEPTTLLDELTAETTFLNLGNANAQALTFARATHNTVRLTVDAASGVKITGATINDWEDTDKGTLSPVGEGLSASEISKDNIPENLTWVITDTELDNSALANLKNVLSSLGSRSKVTIVLPNATTIKFNAFSRMPHMTTVYMPQVTTLEVSAFAFCESLRSVYAPKLTTIGEFAFEEAGLTEFDFTSVTMVDKHAFKGCTNLAEISNLSVSNIPRYVFQDCALSSFDFTGVTETGRGAFRGCTNLAEVSNFSFATVRLEYFWLTAISSFDFSSVTHIENTAFAQCPNLKNVELPSTVVSIENDAFGLSGCTTLNVHWSGDQILTYDTSWFARTPLATINIPAGTTADYVTKGWPEDLLLE